MEAELLVNLLGAVIEDTEVRVMREGAHTSEGIGRVDLINGTMYLVLRDEDTTIVPARDRAGV